jgi:hypothetical protein
MATREVSDGTRTIERWTNEGTAGYYSGNPLSKQRDLTAQEAADLAAMDTANTQAVNGDTLRTQALSALDTNRTYIARQSPTAAQQTAQIKAMAQQLNGVIRLLLGQLDGTN